MICCTLCGDDVEDGGGLYQDTDACCACMEGLPDAEEYLAAELARRRAEALDELVAQAQELGMGY